MQARLLVVEDEPDIATILRMIFDPARYEVMVAGDLAAARELLLQWGPPHLVILDLILPDGNGLDLCRELKAARPPVRVLVLTARWEARDEALAAGTDLFVTKPFELDELEAAVERLLRAV